MQAQYLKVIDETPILNTPNFGQIFDSSKNSPLCDEKGHIRALEFIAFKDMIFEVIQPTTYPYIYEVKCDFYKSQNLFIDSRFTKDVSYNLNPKVKFYKSSKEIISKLSSLIGAKYLWGGNWSRGIEKLLKYYPPSNKLSNDELNKWMLKGVDCTGILFEVTHGLTPRNSIELTKYKKTVPIEQLSPKQISQIVKPLDLIVYKGHLIIVLDDKYTIESREKLGVVTTPIIDRLDELFITKKPQNSCVNNDDFVIRRWFNN